MAKRRVEIDNHNPFIPSFSPVCRVVDQVLVFSVALAGLVAGATAILRQVL